MKDAQPIADAGSLNIEASQATRRSAADGGDVARAPDAEVGNAAPESAEALAAEDADRFAMAFRPSWEPMAPPPEEVSSNGRFKSFTPSLAPVAPHVVQDAGGFLQADLLRLRAARVRKRSLALAAVSILSFGALVYWGISSTTDGADQSATRALQPPEANDPASTAEEVAPAAPAPPPEPTRLTARLADPSAPPAQPAAEPEAAAGTTEAQATEAAAAAPEQAQPAAAPTTVTDVKPATAAAEVQAPPAAADAKPAETQAAAAEPTPLAAAEPKPAPAAPVAAVKPAAATPATAAPVAAVKPAAATPATAAPVAAAKPAAATPATAIKPAPAAPIAAAKPTAASPVAAPPSKPVAAAAPSSEPKPSSAPVAIAAAPRPAPTQNEAPASALKPAPAVESHPPLLVVRTVPDSAQLFLDGQRMSNPFDTRLPLGSKHKIDARQDGYETSSQSIRLESDAKLTITLKRTTPAPEPHIKVSPLPESANGAGFVTSNPY